MKTVWKYALPLVDNFELDLPLGAVALSVMTQKGKPQMWFLVDPQAKTKRRAFRVVGTGNPFDAESAEFVGTFSMLDDEIVFHVFEEKRLCVR